MKNKEILILFEKKIDKFYFYELVGEQYISLFDQNRENIPYMDGIEIMLNNNQYKTFFVPKQDWDWLIDILNPEQYEKVEDKQNKNYVRYLKNNKAYMSQNTKTDEWFFNYNLIYSSFDLKSEDSDKLLNELTKVILKKIYNYIVNKTIMIYI